MTDDTKKALERMGYTGTPGELIRARWLNGDGYRLICVTIGIIEIDQSSYMLDENFAVTYFLKFQELTTHTLVSESISLHKATESGMLRHLRERREYDGIEFDRTSLVLEKHAWNEIRRVSKDMRLQPIAAKLRLL